MRRLLALPFLATLAGASAFAGQEREREDVPRFRGGVEVLQVDVVVTDEEGNFVPGLEASDFELYDDGERQEISTFGLVELPEPQRPPESPAGLPELDYPVATNEGAENARLYMLVLDDINTGFAFGPNVRWLAKKFVEEHVGSSDLVSIGYTSGPALGFTADRKVLVRAVDSFKGAKSSVIEFLDLRPLYGVFDPEDPRPIPAQSYERSGPWISRARVALQVLREHCEWLESVRGRRKSLIWITEGFNYQFTDDFGRLVQDPLTEDYTALVDAAARANVAIYAFSPRNYHSNGARSRTRDYDSTTAQLSRAFFETRSMGFLERLESMRFLRDVSELSGGFARTSPTKPTKHLERVVADSSRYYMLGFSPSDPPVEDELRRIEVRTRREGLVVRTRSGYAGAPKGGEDLSAEATISSSLRDAFSSPVPATGLTLRMAAAPLGGEVDRSTVPVVVRADGRQLGLEERDGFLHGNLELYIRALTYRGEVVDHKDSPVTVRVPLAARERFAEDGFRAMRVLRLEPGSYRIETVVHEIDTGRVASVASYLEVPEFGEATLGGIALTSALESRIPVASDAEDGWSRGYLPSPSPVFGQADELVALVELANPKGRKRLQLNFQVLDGDGSLVYFRVSPVEAIDDGIPVVVSQQVPLDDFAPGQYRVAFRLQTPRGRNLGERHASFEVR